MKVLTTINCFAARNNGSAVFVLAWKFFLDNNIKDIASDFVFVNNGFDETYFNNLVHPYKTYTLKCAAPQPFDTENTYWPILHNHENYDYILRVDHDAFPPKVFFDRMLEFIEANPELDFISASNYPRPIEHNRDVIQALDNRFVPEEEIVKWEWLPWKYPTHNSDLFIIKSSFFNGCLKKYLENPLITSRKSKRQCPFHTNTLKYGEVCSILGHSDGRLPDMAVHIDGSINSDFWTIMCSSKMKMGGILDNGMSFLSKNHVSMYGRAFNFNSFNEIKDPINRSYPHEKAANAPYFHLGNGYLSEWYFDPYSKSTKESFDYFANQFRSPSFGYYVAHYIIIKHLAESAANTELLNMLNVSMTRLFADCNVNNDDFKKFSERVWATYKDGLCGYIKEST